MDGAELLRSPGPDAPCEAGHSFSPWASPVRGASCSECAIRGQLLSPCA